MINTILDIIRLLNDGNIVPMQKDEDTKIDLYNEKVQLFMDASGEESKYYYFSELEIDDENQDNLAEIEDVALNSDAYTVIEKPTPSDSYMILFWKVECIEERMYPDIIKIEENEFFYKKYVFYYTEKELQCFEKWCRSLKTNGGGAARLGHVRHSVRPSTAGRLPRRGPQCAVRRAEPHAARRTYRIQKEPVCAPPFPIR